MSHRKPKGPRAKAPGQGDDPRSYWKTTGILGLITSLLALLGVLISHESGTGRAETSAPPVASSAIAAVTSTSGAATTTGPVRTTARAARLPTVSISCPADFSVETRAFHTVFGGDWSFSTAGASLAIDYGDGRRYATSHVPYFRSAYRHDYAAPGSFRVTVQVTDGNGDAATATCAFTVTQRSSTELGSEDGPRVSLTCPASTNARQSPLHARFGGNWDFSTSGASLAIDYGDGRRYATSHVPYFRSAYRHDYTARGTFRVRIRLTDSGGRAATTTCAFTWS